MTAMILIHEHVSELQPPHVVAINPAFVEVVEQMPRDELGAYGAATHYVRTNGRRLYPVTRADALRVIEAANTDVMVAYSAPIEAANVRDVVVIDQATKKAKKRPKGKKR